MKSWKVGISLTVLGFFLCFTGAGAQAGSCLDGGCHKELTTTRYLHGPVAAEMANVQGCIMCHIPQGRQCSTNMGGDFKLKGKGMCTTCHDKGTGSQHSSAATNCLKCHAPHGSETNANMLRKK